MINRNSITDSDTTILINRIECGRALYISLQQYIEAINCH